MDAKLNVEYLSPGELKTYANNAKLHPAEQVEQIKKSIEEFGFNDPIAVWGDDTIIEGHGRLIAALELGMESVPVIRLDGLTDEQRKAYALVHNKLTMNSDFDADILSIELNDITDIDMPAFGFDDINAELYDYDSDGGAGSLSERYLVPPFSVLYGNRGDWLKRKRYWLDFGIRSELGRGGRLVFRLPEWMERQSQMTRG